MKDTNWTTVVGHSRGTARNTETTTTGAAASPAITLQPAAAVRAGVPGAAWPRSRNIMGLSVGIAGGFQLLDFF
ncbi:hypothetical protein NicSoilB4_21410 [Arthrobacter sp. NicSoilB4]|nr:hypothetical protein NicSoilB4_21410 [Arthrobacter sp. NicSoilB4]